MAEDKKEIAIKIAWHYLGTPYRWGGDDPMEGFDCSGFILEVLQSVGAVPRGLDITADGLYEFFKKLGKLAIRPSAGCLAFWATIPGGHIRHVEMMIDETLSIGASGGGAKIRDLEDAIRQNAYIKIRPVNLNATDLFGFADPFKE